MSPIAPRWPSLVSDRRPIRPIAPQSAFLKHRCCSIMALVLILPAPILFSNVYSFLFLESSTTLLYLFEQWVLIFYFYFLIVIKYKVLVKNLRLLFINKLCVCASYQIV
jgi:hypothetical protein